MITWQSTSRLSLFVVFSVIYCYCSGCWTRSQEYCEIFFRIVVQYSRSPVCRYRNYRIIVCLLTTYKHGYYSVYSRAYNYNCFLLNYPLPVSSLLLITTEWRKTFRSSVASNIIITIAVKLCPLEESCDPTAIYLHSNFRRARSSFFFGPITTHYTKNNTT